MKIAITGKGGVGKTTLSACLAHLLKQNGKEVLAVDADPDANFGMALGFSEEELADVKTIANDRKLIKERTGAEPGISGQWFSLNPTVDDVPKRYVSVHNDIKLLQLGSVESGGAGCACPESTILKALLNHIILNDDDAVICDMEAGIEHLGRGTAGSVDAFIIVVEPGKRSIATAKTIVKLANDIGVNNIYAVVNKCVGNNAAEIEKALGNIPVIGTIPYMREAPEADLNGIPLFEHSPSCLSYVQPIYDFLLKQYEMKPV
ncbi:carbon monoxide dehydrogenase [Anaerobacillus arseniciselenatis]|uniref:Carbon monoxide dehydrogenase n=1 Tax=Anaerobacillus arseniciselenatis TaxID=85682 RepID=A0A1S2LAE8_9BACI|nr:carbon monoxide dehydrogenase accessory protein CooC [Anaerobacillus arseniciselenatis]OIJ09381.1 carbon monoxide dehydrogenase [Anaerobacillus arseniciselenatis]